MTSGVRVSAERCRSGRLGRAYPAARHDVELRVEGATGDALTALLAAAAARHLAEDPACRKVVYAADTSDIAAVPAAERAGFRYVLDVEVVDEGALRELSLLVCEPNFVTRVDLDLDRIPQT